jgi:AcrR family transcriptional regulator
MSIFGKNKDDGEQQPSKCIIKRISAKRQQALADREAELLVIAEQLVAKDGFANFTMDKLTANASYSKGTIYNHFNSKEDLIAALCIKSLRKELSLFRQAQTFEGNLREKCLALLYAYQLHAHQNPTLFMCVLCAKTPAVMEKASPERLQTQDQLSKEVIDFCDNLFAQAMTDGVLALAPDVGQDSLTFALWAMAFGTNALMVSAGEIESISRLDHRFTQLNHANLLLDGMGWQPLSSEWDYKQTWMRIESELFVEDPATSTT